LAGVYKVCREIFFKVIMKTVRGTGKETRT
jgi:hypothetical protein